MKERPIDTIQLTVTPGEVPLTPLYGATVIDGKEYVHRVCINGEGIWSDGVELYEFEKMLEAPGDYWPFICSYCGEAGCAEIWYPVRCYHKGDLLILVIRDPLQDNCWICDESECSTKPEDCPKARPHYRAYLIQKEQLRQQLEALHREFGDHLGKSVW